MKEKEIILNEFNKLILQEDGSYKLQFKHHYYVGYTEEGNLYLNPYKGPFITKGTEIQGHIVDKVDNHCNVWFI